MAIQRITPMFTWPKQIPELSQAQVHAREDFMVHWHQVLPKKYGMIEKFNHVGAFTHPIEPGTRTLEIGAGLGAHIEFEDLSKQEYVANELRAEMGKVIQTRFPNVEVIIGDVQDGLSAATHSFDRVLAVHVLEHLPRLPQALREIKRVLKPGGYFQVVIPCEGSLAYTIARNISARRIFEKRYKMSYDFLPACEHVNLAREITYALKQEFNVDKQRFFPFSFLPIEMCNLVISMLCRPKNT